MSTRQHHNNQEKITLEDLYAYLHESSKEFKQRMQERDEEARKWDEETRKRDEEAERRAKKFELERAETWRQMKEDTCKLKESMEEDTRQLKESIKETDRQLKVSMKKSKKETDRQMRKMSRELGGIGHSNGETAEEYFQNAFQKSRKLNGEIYNKVNFNVKPLLQKGQEEDEYDIVLENGKSVAIIEVKYSVREENIEKVLNKPKTFRAFYPEYENYKLYLGIASFSFKKVKEESILKAGIAVIKQVGDKMVINSENLKVF
jgi:hypothetical protein